MIFNDTMKNVTQATAFNLSFIVGNREATESPWRRMIKPLKAAIIILLLSLNLAIAPPASADTTMSKVSPEYPKVVQELKRLSKLKSDPQQTKYTLQELNRKISDALIQKKHLETAEDWGICSNRTDRTLAIYAHKPKSFPSSNFIALYYLAPNRTTDEDWDCDGLYIPSGSKVAGFTLTEGEPNILEILDGTKLVATTNSEGEIVFNVPSALVKVLRSKDVTWPRPNLTQANIDLHKPNAPTD